jgi:hypothetical protein
MKLIEVSAKEPAQLSSLVRVLLFVAIVRIERLKVSE